MDVDKELILRRFGSSFETYDQQADVQRRICGRLAELIPEIDVRHGMEIGAGTGFLTRNLIRRWPDAMWTINDLSPAAEQFLVPLTPGTTFLCGDAERIEYPDNQDIIASASTVQWFSDMPKFVHKSAMALNRNGVLALSSFGPENFREMRPTGLDYLSLDELTALLQSAGFEIRHSEQYLETLEFDSPHAVLRYIKALGLNALDRKNYTKHFNATQLTYHPLLVVASLIEE